MLLRWDEFSFVVKWIQRDLESGFFPSLQQGLPPVYANVANMQILGKQEKMKYVTGSSIPAPKGHYSPAVVHGGLVYVAGQLPADPGGRDMAKATIEDQVRQTLANIATILDAGGSSLDRILRATVYVADVALWPRLNAAYAEVMGEHRPARTVVPVPELHYGYLVEIDVIAVLRDS